MRKQTCALIVVALLCLWLQMGRGATASIILRNVSDKPVTVSADPSQPLQGPVVAPGGTLVLTPASYYLSNQKIAQAYLTIDTRLYVIKNALTTVGLVEVYLAVLGSGTVSVITDTIPITGEF